MELEPAIAVTVGPAGLPPPTLTPATPPFDLLALTAGTMAPAGDDISAPVELAALPLGPDAPEPDGSELPDPGTALPVAVSPPVPTDPAAIVTAPPSPPEPVRRTVATPNAKPRAANDLSRLGQVLELGALPVVANAIAGYQPLGERAAPDTQPDAIPDTQPVVMPNAQSVANPDAIPPLVPRVPAWTDTASSSPSASFVSEPGSRKLIGVWAPDPTDSPGRVDDIHVEATSVDHVIDAVRIESSSARLVDALASALPSVGRSLAEQGLLVASVSVAVADRSAGAPLWDAARPRRSSSSSFRASPISRRMRFTAYA